MARAAPMPASRCPRTTEPSARNTNRAPRTNPPGVDQARSSSHMSSVLIGSGTSARQVDHHSPMRLVSTGCASIARPIFPPGSSG